MCDDYARLATQGQCQCCSHQIESMFIVITIIANQAFQKQIQRLTTDLVLHNC